MIHITINRSNRSFINSFEVSGHANSAPYGYDIVCAAVSAVTIGFVNVIIDLEFIYKPSLQVHEGYVLLELNERNAKDERVELLLKAMLHILKQIKEQHSDYIQIKEL